MAAITRGFPFSFDFIVEDLKVVQPNRRFVIKSQFADVFSLMLKYRESNDPKIKGKKFKGKTKKVKRSTKEKTKAQSIIYVGDVHLLMAYMMQYPMEICLCEPSDPEQRIGSTLIPWNPAFTEYLVSLYLEPNPPPVRITDAHSIFDELTSKRMAIIRLTIKLSLSENINWNQYTVLSKSYPRTYTLLEDIIPKHSNPSLIMNESPGVIKTTYAGGKKKRNKNKRYAKRDKNVKKQDLDKPSDHADLMENIGNSNKVDKRMFDIIKSDTFIPKRKRVHLFHSISCNAIKQINPFDYIFGDAKGPFGEKIYTVGYLSVADDPKSKTPSSASHSNSIPTISTTSIFSLDPELITPIKCDKLGCKFKKERPLLETRDDRITLGIDSLNNTCCVTENTKRQIEIIGAVKRKEMDPCLCACECSFNFERKTTYCKICRGYEKPGEKLDGLPQYLMPDPCPIYHKITKCKTGSTSGSESKSSKKRAKSPEPEKKNKYFKGNIRRFKFNYGYTAPRIGHSLCAMPCTGTMSNVPKYMGWLWTADNVPGLAFRPLWRPGAINKMVLRKLRMARHPGEIISKRRKVQPPKKRSLKRPLLVVQKKDGEYEVTMETMKTYTRPRTINQPPYEEKPVMTYTIGRTEEENLERKRRKERAMRRLEREKREYIQSAFRDMCKEICIKTYQQALAILPDAEDPVCSCYPALTGPEHVAVDRSCPCSDPETSIGSDTDSDEWILEFTPPNAYYDPQYPGAKLKMSDNETQYTYLDYRVKLLDRFGNPVPRFFKGPDGTQQCSDLGGFWSNDHNWLEINVDGYIAPDGRWAPMHFIGPRGEQVNAETGKFHTPHDGWLVVGVDGYVDSNNKWKFYRSSLNAQTAVKQQQHQYSYKKKHRERPARERSPRERPARERPARERPARERPVRERQSRDHSLTRRAKEDRKTKKKDSEPAFSCFGDATPLELSKMGIVGHGPDKKLLNRILKSMIAKGAKVKIPQVPQLPRSSASGRSRSSQHRTGTDGSRKDRDYRMKKFAMKTKKERILDLEHQGRSLSAFHEPCFQSDGDGSRPQKRDVVVKMNRAGDKKKRR